MAKKNRIDDEEKGSTMIEINEEVQRTKHVRSTRTYTEGNTKQAKMLEENEEHEKEEIFWIFLKIS